MWWSRRGLRAHCTRDLFEDPNSVERKIHLSGFKTAMIYYDPLIVVTAIKKKIVNSYWRNEVKRQGRGGGRSRRNSRTCRCYRGHISQSIVWRYVQVYQCDMGLE